MATVSNSDVYYDSADYEIATNPYEVFKRFRYEAPLYYNSERDFYAVSRFDDVTKVLADSQTYINKFGGTLDLIKSGFEIPPGTVLFEDEPANGMHRALLSRMFTPKKVALLDEQIRTFCTDVLDAIASGASTEDAASVAAEGTEASSDLNASSEYRRRLARVLVRRGLEEARSRS